MRIIVTYQIDVLIRPVVRVGGDSVIISDIAHLVMSLLITPGLSCFEFKYALVVVEVHVLLFQYKLGVGLM